MISDTSADTSNECCNDYENMSELVWDEDSDDDDDNNDRQDGIRKIPQLNSAVSKLNSIINIPSI